ncbi:hypothetical protein FIM07_05200 [SAR202 cluster bacterium AD-802-F09_MRT_200m]|nr:hypothetical protein [SAR202 cluster bacterium AD-802-F09_MRT_200m]
MRRWRGGFQVKVLEKGHPAKEVKSFKSWEERLAEDRGPFRLRNFDEQDLGWDAGQYVLELWRDINSQDDHRTWSKPKGIGISDPLTNPVALTFHEAAWAWRIHQLAPTLGTQDVYVLAIVCADRDEARTESTTDGTSDDLVDVLAYLAFRPWENGMSHYRYLNYTDAFGNGTKTLSWLELFTVVGRKVGYFQNAVGSGFGGGLPGISYPNEVRDLLHEPDYPMPSSTRRDGLPPYPTPGQLLAWAKLGYMSYAASSGSGVDEFARPTLESLRPIIDQWGRMPPFAYDYRDLESIAPLMALDENMPEFIDNLIRCLPDDLDLDKPSLMSLLLVLSPDPAIRRLQADREALHAEGEIE